LQNFSSLEYDPFNERLLTTTSYEQGDRIGGYLWTLPMSQREPGGPPSEFAYSVIELP